MLGETEEKLTQLNMEHEETAHKNNIKPTFPETSQIKLH
jgi:hypothetical protein